MKKNSKKKGFTLIELIAVIAILGILAAVIVPNILGYTNKAKKGKAVADAKIIINAIDAHNAEVDNGTGKIDDTVLVSALKVNSNIVGANAPIKEVGSFPKEFQADTAVSDLRALASGILTYDDSIEGEATLSANKTKYKIGKEGALKDKLIFEK